MTKDDNNHSTIKLLSFMAINESFSKNFQNKDSHKHSMQQLTYVLQHILVPSGKKWHLSETSPFHPSITRSLGSFQAHLESVDLYINSALAVIPSSCIHRDWVFSENQCCRYAIKRNLYRCMLYALKSAIYNTFLVLNAKTSTYQKLSVRENQTMCALMNWKFLQKCHSLKLRGLSILQ